MRKLAAGPYVPDQAAITGGPPSARVSPTAVAALALDAGHSFRTGMAPDCMPAAVASRATAVITTQRSPMSRAPRQSWIASNRPVLWRFFASFARLQQASDAALLARSWSVSSQGVQLTLP